MAAPSSHPGPLIKICGVTRTEALTSCHLHGVDFVGFNFFRGSKRYIEPVAALRIWNEFSGKNPAHSLRPVAVTVDASLSDLIRIRKDFPALTALQLHGRETGSFVAECRRHCGADIWKAVSVSIPADADQVLDYLQTADMVLLDSAAVAPGASVPGGSGRTFDWSLFAGLIGRPDIGVAGGLTPDNISGLLPYKPALVDLASGVESSPGVKSREKIESLVKTCRVRT
jgi:phosphoribosylanthranilate isomerase